jgi:carotenoid cleavage dioxygenase-like enzyme
MEAEAVPLRILEGALPNELRGHLYVVAPVGTVAWPWRPVPDQPPIMNGDGKVARIDFEGGAAKATVRMTRPPCQIADELTVHAGLPLSLLQFIDAGIARLSPLLGARDFLNTAFVPITRPGQPTRLLLTYDAGRPYEIDPVTLKVVGPMGAAAEWAAETFDTAPFPMILSAGHPFFDPRTGEVFTINYGRSLQSMGPHPDLMAQLKLPLPGGMPQSFTHLVRWDGDGKLQHWKLVGADGKDIEVAQSVHQVAVTRNWILCFDTAFRVGFEQWFNDPLPHQHSFEAMLRALLARPQLPYTTVWLIPRAALGQGSTDPKNPTPVKVAAATIPVESAHLLADYDDTGDVVTAHLSHCAASDLAEWVRPFDTSFYDGSEPRGFIEGMVAIGSMDVNRLGRYRIDAKTGAILDSKLVWDDRLTWAVALYAGRELPALGAVPEKIDQLFWSTAGFFPELLTKFVHDMYANYKNRVTPLEEIAKLAQQGGRPSTLIRVDTATMQIADSHEAPPSVIIASPQYVPNSSGGWLISTVYTPDRAELWCYDAQRLSAGPFCRIDAAQLGIGFSLHTAWLPELQQRTATYRIDVATDTGGRGNDQVKELIQQVAAKT